MGISRIAESLRMAATSSNPFMPGSDRSVITRSTRRSRSSAIPLSPSGALTTSKDITFRASKTLLITIPSDAEANKGTLTNPRLDAFGPANGIVVHGAVPLTLNFLNKDATPHVIHGNNQNGFVHGDSLNPIPQGGMDRVRTITAAGSYDFYLHDQGPVTLGKLILQAN